MKRRLPLLALPFLLTASTHASLLAFYPFDTNTDDATGRYNPTAGTAPLVASGYEGGAVSFNGTSNFLSIPLDINPAAIPQFTMGAWARTDLTGRRQVVLSHDNGGFDRTLDIDERASRPSYTWSALIGEGNGVGVHSSGVTAAIDTWVFLAVTYDQAAGNVTLFVDGSISSVVTPNAIGAGLSTTAIGRNPTGEIPFFSGLIDNVFFYDQALTPIQVNSIRNGGASAIRTTFGDYNRDGYVDAADYTLWADTFGQTGTLLPADGNYDGRIDAADYTIWADNFGHGTPPPAIGIIPEPASLALALPALATLSRRRR